MQNSVQQQQQQPAVEGATPSGGGGPFFLLSVSMTSWLDYYTAFQPVREQSSYGVYKTTELPSAMQEAAGMLAIVDWGSKACIGSLRFEMPQGTCYHAPCSMTLVVTLLNELLQAS
eukprot:TRINITY_DN7482_c0_g1_i1.p1 TRINITY_DN7482_c0_g1~~TRINITY_DN7482_c0_g1_i1.p1  ORF type:complete len:116 (+),score=21.25 TRINITY_DN7482_c0_g1_i1:51-398(+)